MKRITPYEVAVSLGMMELVRQFSHASSIVIRVLINELPNGGDASLNMQHSTWHISGLITRLLLRNYSRSYDQRVGVTDERDIGVTTRAMHGSTL